MSAPAYTAVSTRRTFGESRPIFVPSSTTSQATPPPTRKAPFEWPQPVREYVQRTFAVENKVSSVGKDELGLRLKQVINKSIEDGRLHETDWPNHPLPQELMLREREARLVAPARFPSPETSSLPAASATAMKSSPESDSSKKRKFSGADSTTDIKNETTDPTWRKPQIKNVFEDRVEYTPPAKAKKQEKQEKRKQKFQEQNGTFSKSNGKLEERRNRFNLDKPMPIRASPPVPDARQLKINQGPIVGTCEDIYKSYYRLTSAPDPKNVRPLRVLRKTLEALISNWKADNNYSYICGQFKSLRQDITVQRITNDFTVRVYEVHARIALEKADVGEYNQCQTRLRALYKQRLGGHPGEFLAYRVLYFLYTCNRTDMSDLLANITPADRQDAAVQHALQTRSALALGNYHRFFKLYMDTPNLGAYLMDMFIVRERLAALARITKSYKQTLPLRFLSEELAFESDEQCAGFILDHGGENILERSDQGVKFSTAKAGQTFEVAKAAAFGGVDIKGQI